ncbi:MULTISPECIES: FkbM family methyltransferase [unclassified Ectothiorhodospira]|uniref:FkbM family methyltransferase n=1 Tax=unclassified Ectothiorhodospira TaxID=2684909 RepID=UPI001EE79951|nr:MULTISPECIES: FkbM family methyltransferase [unclassified Ectothiorhodospira]MCG5517207.1 FkbM family methyltransferase [Ectothiorhodospira sp. 9100]MCG5519770.1 FkbM family methyltransferase [Ectothiorhodospira sp. 9905]
MNRIIQQIKATLPPKLLLRVRALDNYFNGEREIRLLRKLCPPGREAIDVGANIGIYTYFLSKYSSHVYAFEPNPVLARQLVDLFPHATIRNVAISDKHQTLTLNVPSSTSGPDHAQGSVSCHYDKNEIAESYTIEAIPLDSLTFNDVGFIKIDVEQHELQVLHGAESTIAKHRPAIMTEATPLLYPEPMPDMFSFIVEQGYTGWFHFGDAYYPFTSFDPETHANRANWKKSFMGTNVIFLPSETDPIARLGKIAR